MTGTEVSSGEDRLRRIELVTDTALAHLAVEDLLDELLERVRSLLHADTAAVLLLDPSSTHLVATAARGIEEEVRQGVRIPLGQGFAGRIAAERRPVVIEQVDHANVLNPILREKAVRSLLGVPLIAEGTVLGVLHVGTLTTRTFVDEDAELLQLAADRIASMTRTHLTELDRATAAALQRSLMPGTLPAVPGLELAARYIPGDAGGLGGDWYDVFTLPSGRVGVVIGDVVGRGLQAAVVMGRLRSALRAFALEEDDPAEVLERLDGNVQHFEDGVMATVLYAVFEPSMERLALSTAGHLPPVVASPSDHAALLEVPVDLPVGVSVGPPRRTTVVDLPPGGLLFLYTDGLVERRRRSLDVGLDLLTDAVTVDEVETVCSTVLGRLVGSEHVTDDVAMLVARRLPGERVVPLDVVLPAVPRSLAEVRSALRRWLVAAEAPADATADLLVACGEACSNVVEHAYGPGGGTVAVRAVLEGGEVTATVRDNGQWRSARGEGRGRGTTLMRQCCDDVDVTTGVAGTTVTLRRRLVREAG
ncbi:SpoIIE family protein phosphatase [Actinomycetospora sp. TBRC 11914]|uniref:ATP-binding SpoIIE family protein phosphatase n=1 Tax=Actinomycetospora sp. TBRC 11914 TaxID=2729387 RepID=UPI00145FA0A9|nr:SpoIIE family protein phosphatase [Actinomycetospora sp. TBRC 11914]NMO91308.1 SpoIIE family protein phosphatase [Actinomycetospora sp. TBRC 11914]